MIRPATPGVFECPSCEGFGRIAPDEYDQPHSSYCTCIDCLSGGHECSTCDGRGIAPCEVCGSTIRLTGFDCIVCETVGAVQDDELALLDPAAFARALERARDARLREIEAIGNSLPPIRPIDTTALEASNARLEALTKAHREEMGEARWAEISAAYEVEGRP